MKRTVTISIKSGASKADALAEAGRALGREAKNLDALHDILTDIGEETEIRVEAEGDVPKGFEEVFKDSMAENPNVVAVFTRASRRGGDEKRRLWYDGSTMQILVCIKQVPGTTQVEIDPKTGTLKRDGVESKMNPFDLYALETALRLKERFGGEVAVLTMGPPQAEAVVREAFMMGADRGFVLSDRRFGGADVLATSYTLAQGAKKAGGFDLVVCGRQTTDGDTAQVGPELAERLGIPHVANVRAVADATDTSITVEVDEPGHVLKERIPFPCLITVDKGAFEPRLPSFRLKLATADREITWLKLDDLEDRDPAHYGLNGSPTQVKRIFPPDNHVEQVELAGTDAEKAAKACDYLAERKFV